MHEGVLRHILFLRVFHDSCVGVSRSVTLLLMHLIVRHRLPLHSAFRYVRSCRYCNTAHGDNSHYNCNGIYFLWYNSYDSGISLVILLNNRPQINPNDSFKLQLAKLEVQELRGSSVSKDADKAWDFYDWNRCEYEYFTTVPCDFTFPPFLNAVLVCTCCVASSGPCLC